MQTIIRYTLLTASRDWLFLGLCSIILLAYGFSVFVGATALVEQAQMSLAYFAGSGRIIMVTGLVVFMCFHIRRSFENREIEAVLSKPISRTKFVISYWLGFTILGIIAVLPFLFILVFLNNPDIGGFVYWAASLICEISLMLAFGLLASLIMGSAVAAVMSTCAFYLISRLMGFFLVAIDNPTSLLGVGLPGQIMEHVMMAISTIIPRLDMFAKSQWLIYGLEGQSDLWIFPLQSIVYIALLLSVAIFDFKRKQF